MKGLFTIWLIILLVTVGCIENKTSDTQNGDFVTIDVVTKYPKKELILQDFLDVEYIPLETTDEFTTTAYVQAIGKDIILVRNTNQAGGGNIFIFDRKGKGLKRINRRGQGNEEYTAIMGIALDEDKEEMYVNCGALSKIFVYDLAGNFKRSLKYIDLKSQLKAGMVYDPIFNFDQDHLIVQDFSSGRFYDMGINDIEPRNIFFIISKQDGSVTKEMQIPFEKKVLQTLLSKDFIGIGMVYNPGLIPFRKGWILTESSADTIYNYSADHDLQPFIVRTPSVQSMEPEVFLFPGVITDRYYFLQTVKKEHAPEEHMSGLLEIELVYDKQEQKTFECIVYNDDFITKRQMNSMVDYPPLFTVINNNEIAFAEKIEAYELVEAYKEGKLKGKLKEIASSLDEESNPVIMLAKHKKQTNN